MVIPQVMIKYDRNFIDKPLWYQFRATPAGPLIIDANGYRFSAKYKPPNFTDIVILFAMMKKSQENGYSPSIMFSCHEILLDCDMDASKKAYLRLKESLKIWNAVFVEYTDTFFDGKDYISLDLRIMDRFCFLKNKKVCVEFNPRWLKCQEESNWFSLVDFALYRALKFPKARRLYEFFLHELSTKDRWDIPYAELGFLLDMKPKKNTQGEDVFHRSEIIRDITAPIEVINNLCLNPGPLYNKGIQEPISVDPHYGRKSITFVKATAKLGQVKKQGQARQDLNTDDMLQQIIEKVARPISEDTKLLLAVFYRQKGAEYIARAIDYVNHTNKDPEKFSRYLQLTLQHDWAVD